MHRTVASDKDVAEASSDAASVACGCARQWLVTRNMALRLKLLPAFLLMQPTVASKSQGMLHKRLHLWLVLSVGAVISSWQGARETYSNGMPVYAAHLADSHQWYLLKDQGCFCESQQLLHHAHLILTCHSITHICQWQLGMC